MKPKKLSSQEIEANTQLLAQASHDGDLEKVQRLLPLSDPRKYNSYALKLAVEQGYIEIVKLLIPVSNAKANGSTALWVAAKQGHTECVQMLIPVSDPKADDSTALRFAAKNEHIECVKLLIPVSDYKKVIKQMQKYHQDITLIQQCIDEYEALQQKERLKQQIGHISKNKTDCVRKM